MQSLDSSTIRSFSTSATWRSTRPEWVNEIGHPGRTDHGTGDATGDTTGDATGDACCLDDQELLELADGLGGDRTLARHRAHLSICAACRSLFAEVEACLTRSRDVAPASRTPAAAAHTPTRYRFLRSLGAGGTASVVAARDTVLDRDVAVKTLHPWLRSDANAIVRFLQEAHLMARLAGRAAPRVIDVGTNEMGLPFIVMELLEGETLGARLRRKRKLAVDEALTLIASVCDALAISHACGVIHRDVKPGNIIITESGARGRALPHGALSVKLVDFGLAKADGAARQASEVGDVFGTPGYMPPEQMRDAHEADARSDIWAVGALLYRCLTGENPFASALRPEAALSYVPARARRAEVPSVLDEIIARCLRPAPRLRYASATELAAALRAVSSVTTVVIPPRPRRPANKKVSADDIARIALAAVAVLLCYCCVVACMRRR